MYIWFMIIFRRQNCYLTLIIIRLDTQSKPKNNARRSICYSRHSSDYSKCKKNGIL
jgi:hypothetical protein